MPGRGELAVAEGRDAAGADASARARFDQALLARLELLFAI
ncbi:hypothetical protein [Mesorhizobium xinjiangense]|nr:hypothetical protein [Mesorhizobium xinjiangense]